MNRIKLKRGGCRRRKALLGADGAIQAAATLAAAAMTTGATIKSAKEQAKATINSATTQAKALEAQNTNNNNLQKESIEFTRSQNQENRQQQQDIQTTLQMLAGQQNMNDRLRSQKVQARYGKRCMLEKGGMQSPFYGGGSPFQITDGGGAVPLQTDINGFGLYELVGNDHDHYHKTKGGKYKSGVGVKLPTGEVVEGEGNQNTNNGELMYITPNDALFLSKHSIDGFNPAKAVKQGLHPEEAYIAQETLKQMNNLNDDGSKKKKSIKGKTKKKLAGGYNVLHNAANLTQSPFNAIVPTAGGVAYLVNRGTTSPVAKYGTRRKLKSGFGVPFDEWEKGYTLWNSDGDFSDDHLTLDYMESMNNWIKDKANYNKPSWLPVKDAYWEVLNQLQNSENKDRYMELFPVKSAEILTGTGLDEVTISAATPEPAPEPQPKPEPAPKDPKLKSSSGNWSRGAMYSTIGNLVGAGLTTAGNMIASNKLGKAYTEAGNILSSAYNNLKTIDPNLIKKDDYKAAHAIAAIRDANYRNSAMRERVRRNAEAENREINRGTLSSAARQQRLASTNDRYAQRISELAEQENNINEQTRQGNMERITQTSQFNAQQDNQASKDFTGARLALAQYNNDIENTKIMGAAQAASDALSQKGLANATALQSSANNIGQALINSGNAFANAFSLYNKYENDFLSSYGGLGDRDKIVVGLTKADKTGDYS